MSDAPIKTCDYCGTTGKMPTFMNGETTCLKCLGKAPKSLKEANQVIHKLREELKIVKNNSLSGDFILPIDIAINNGIFKKGIKFECVIKRLLRQEAMYDT